MKEKLSKLAGNYNTSRIMALVLSLLLCISVIGIIASAASVTKDGLEATLTTDKEEYSSSEPIVATLSVENKGNTIIDEMNLETLIPDGYHIESAATATKNVEQIRVGEKAVLAVTLLPNSSTTPETPVTPGPVTPETPSDDGKASSNSGTNKQNDRDSDNSKSSSTSSTSKKISNSSSSSSTRTMTRYNVTTATGRSANPTNVTPNKVVNSVNTGDETHIWIWGIMALVSMIGLIVIVLKKKHSWKISLSGILIVALGMSLFGGWGIFAKAEEVHHYVLAIKTEVLVADKDCDIHGVVTVNPKVKDYSNGDYLYIPSGDDIDFDEKTLELYVNNYVLAYLVSPLNNSQQNALAKTANGLVSGIIEGPVNVVQIKVEKASREKLAGIANDLMKDSNVYYASYDTPLVISPDEDKNPWPNESGIGEVDKGNEKMPSGNDWWAEAIGAYSAWNYTSYAKPITVGILDDGYYSHNDFPDFSYLSDYTDNAIDSGSAHGTHVAGLIAAQNNSIGIRGVADKAQIIVNDYSVVRNGLATNMISNGEYTEIINQMLIAGKKAGTPVVINNSWFSVGLKATKLEHYLDENYWINIKPEEDYTKALNNCFATATHCVAAIIGCLLHGYDDFIIVQSAGNGLKDEDGKGYGEGIPSIYNGSYAAVTEDVYNRVVENTSPIFLDNHNIDYSQIKGRILIVGAAKNERAPYGQYYAASFSNFGENVDIFAPGEDIISTIDNNGYGSMSGTSMAAPIACGSAALLWSLNPDLPATEIKRLLINSGNSAFGVGIDAQTLYPMLNIKFSIEQSPFYEKLNNDERPVTPGDISGIDDPEPSQENNGHYYKVFDDDLTWDEAKSICESYGGHLVTITSQKENEIVSGLVEDGSMGAYWIGAQRDDDWKWITGEDFTYSSWQPNRPDDNESGMVIQLFNNNVYENQLGLWDDTWTDGDHAAGLREQGYVCEWDSKQAYENGFGFASGSGTEEDPYVITTPAELNHVRHHLSSSFILGNDIDMAAWNNWEPIGKAEYEKDFAGVFDGNNKTIKNLHLGENADKESNHALFGEVSGTLTNIIIDNLTITINHEELIHDGEIENWSQLIGGLLLHGGNVDNCKVSGNITVSSLTTPVIESGAGLSIGGISAGSSNIRNCESNVNIRLTAIEKDISISAGGISGDGGVIHDCINKGAISTENVFYGMLGGIAGEGFWSKITNCSNYGDVKNTLSDISLKEEYLYGEFLNVGGIAGRTGTAYDVETIISNCYNYASCVQNDGSSTRVGRIFGSCDGLDESSLEISNNYSIKSTLVNGVIPREGIAANQKNGANL